MNYPWIIELNFFCALTLLIILASLLKNYDRQSKQIYYIRSVSCGILSCLLDINWALLESGILPEPRIFNYLTNGGYYITTILMGYFWLLYVETSLGNQKFQTKTVKCISFTLVAFVIIGVIISFFYPFFFYIDNENIYRRGSFSYLHTISCHAYTFTTSLHAFSKSFRTKDYLKSLEYRVLSVFLVFPLAIGIIQIFFPGIPTVSLGITFAFFYVYVDLQNLLISVDTLSGLNNKNQLMRYLSGKIRNISSENQLFIIMIDVNKFKKINDTFGHMEGDEAIKRCALAIKLANHNSKNFIARFGGDEFIIVVESVTEKDVIELKEAINTKLEEIRQKDNVPYELTMSIGYAKYNSSMRSIQDVIKEADKNLYEIKKAGNNIRRA